MKQYTEYPARPGTQPEEVPEQNPATPKPEPKRRRVQQPLFRTARKVGFVLAMVVVTTSLVAQSTTTPRTGTTQQQPTDQGWTMFDDRVATDMNIDADRLDRLRAVDKSYHARYDALGKEPWSSKEYPTLTEQRNREIEGILSPAQYDEWQRRYPVMNDRTGTEPMDGTRRPDPPQPFTNEQVSPAPETRP